MGFLLFVMGRTRKICWASERLNFYFWSNKNNGLVEIGCGSATDNGVSRCCPIEIIQHRSFRSTRRYYHLPAPLSPIFLSFSSLRYSIGPNHHNPCEHIRTPAGRKRRGWPAKRRMATSTSTVCLRGQLFVFILLTLHGICGGWIVWTNPYNIIS